MQSTNYTRGYRKDIDNVNNIYSMFIGLVVHKLCAVYKHRRLATLRSDPGLKCAEKSLKENAAQFVCQTNQQFSSDTSKKLDITLVYDNNCV